MTQETLEAQLAAKIYELRTKEELTYRQLADRLKELGCNVNPGTIQKTEKAGRRVPVDELVGYSRAFDLSLNELLGLPDGEQLTRVWQTYIGLERLAQVLRSVRGEYSEALREVQELARTEPALANAIRERRGKYLATFEQKARVQAANDGDDVSTPEKLHEFMVRWGYYDVPVLTAAHDVLEGVNDGEGE